MVQQPVTLMVVIAPYTSSVVYRGAHLQPNTSYAGVYTVTVTDANGCNY